MDESINLLGKAHMFSNLDAGYDYWQVEMDKLSGDDTVFASHHGLYQLVRMLFRLKIASVIFRRAMKAILSFVK